MIGLPTEASWSRIRRLTDLLLTTNHVVAETITLARVRAGHDLAVKVGRYLYGEKMARVHWASPAEEKAAFEYLAKHRDKEYSFTDCLSFVVMDAFGISEAWAVDSDFSDKRDLLYSGKARQIHTTVPY